MHDICKVRKECRIKQVSKHTDREKKTTLPNIILNRTLSGVAPLTVSFGSTIIFSSIPGSMWSEISCTPATATTSTVEITFSGFGVAIESISCVCSDNLDPE